MGSKVIDEKVDQTYFQINSFRGSLGGKDWIMSTKEKKTKAVKIESLRKLVLWQKIIFRWHTFIQYNKCIHNSKFHLNYKAKSLCEQNQTNKKEKELNVKNEIEKR